MNKHQIEAKCPRCSGKEDWEHLIKCPNVRREQMMFVMQLEKKMEKIERHKFASNDEKEQAKTMIEDLKQYFVDEGQLCAN